MSERSIRLFQTAPHPCGYFAGREASDVLLDPHADALPEIYPQALASGFRRSGGHVYRPRCPDCQACQPLRLPLAQFRPSRSQQRSARRNADLTLNTELRAPNDEQFALYQRYLAARHAGGGMDEGSRWDFEQFVRSPWSPTRFFELRLAQQLVAVAITDISTRALSAVYTFFDPDLAERSLGTAAILRQIAWGQATGREHLYLGFFIDGHAKMKYKAGFRPAELLVDGHWRPSDQVVPAKAADTR